MEKLTYLHSTELQEAGGEQRSWWRGARRVRQGEEKDNGRGRGSNGGRQTEMAVSERKGKVKCVYVRLCILCSRRYVCLCVTERQADFLSVLS